MGKNRDHSKFPNAITVLDNGNVGIGMNNPTSIGAYRSLTMNGVDGCIIDLNFNGSDNGRIYTSSEAAIGIESLSTTLPLVFKTQNGSGSTERMRITSSGNVGIGTSSPSYKLHIPQGNDLFLSNLYITGTANNPILDSGATGGSIGVYGGGNGAGRMFLQGAAPGGSGYVRFDTDGSERMRITNSGNVGIATNGPTFRLDISEAGSVINGTATIGSNMKGIRIYNSTTATNNNAIGLWFSTGPHQAGIASFRATADTTWETSLAFYTHVNNTSNLNDATEKMRISGEGYVTSPYQPSFMAAGNSGSISVSGGNVLIFNANRYNTGGHFNNGNGRFTAPVAGKYLFSWNIYHFGGYVTGMVLTINGSQYAPADVVPYTYRSSSDPEGTTGCTVQLDLSANDYVEVRVRAGFGAAQIYMSHSYFTGHLLS